MPEPIFAEIDQFFEKFNRTISIIKAVKPTNINEEREKFFSRQGDYNPQFLYKPLRADLTKREFNIVKLLKKVPQTEIGLLYAAKLNECQSILTLIKNAGNNPQIFTETAIKLFGQPKQPYIQYAQRVITKSKQISASTAVRLQAEHIARLFQTEINQLELPNTIDIVDEPGRKDKISILKVSGTIKIGSEIQRTEDSIKGAIAHEIGVHALRTFRGSQHPYRIFQFGTAQYLRQEEGLAILISFCIKENKLLTTPAKMYTIINHALRSDFKSTFQLASQLYPEKPNKAWLYTVRTKRGIADTSQPFAFTKDLYFQWAIQAANAILKDPKILKYAFNGKGNYAELEKFTEPQKEDILKPSQILQFLKQNDLPFNR